MTDYFALLLQPRRPWLEDEQLKSSFLERSAASHPDRVHSLGPSERAEAQERYVELNAAYQCLREPRERIRHLLKLELGAAPGDIKQIPERLMQEFFRVGTECRAADALLKEKDKIVSPLLKVEWFQKAQTRSDSLLELARAVNAKRDALLDRVRLIDAGWSDDAQPDRRSSLNELESVHHGLGFYERWIAQIQERVTQLAI